MEQPVAKLPRSTSFNVSDHYEIQGIIGEGAYGLVWYVAYKFVRYMAV